MIQNRKTTRETESRLLVAFGEAEAGIQGQHGLQSKFQDSQSYIEKFCLRCPTPPKPQKDLRSSDRAYG